MCPAMMIMDYSFEPVNQTQLNIFFIRAAMVMVFFHSIRNPNLNSNLYKIWQAVYYYMLQALASAFEFFNCFIRVLNYIVYTYTYMYTKTTYRGQRTINNMWVLVFSFHRVSSRDQTQMINLDGKHLYLLNHLTRSPHPFNFFSLFQMLTWSFIHQVY